MAKAIPQPWVKRITQIVEEAGAEILKVYETDFEIQTKSDESPLTQADLAAHQVILAGLQSLTPEIPIISEESAPPSFAQRSQWKRYWLVDPLDGTKEFVNRNGEFTVNIALIDGHDAVFGVVGVPVQKKVYVGDVNQSDLSLRSYVEINGDKHLLPGKSYDEDSKAVRVVASRNHGGERLESYLVELASRFAKCERRSVGSSLKLCVLAEGGADIYPRLGPTSEWDIGAAHAVLTAAGGGVYQPEGESLAYNIKESLLNPEFLAVGDASYPWQERLPAFPAR